MARLASVLLLIAGLLQPCMAGDAPLVDLSANELPDGELIHWINRGALGGAFDVGMSSGPAVKTVAGRRAVVFDRDRHLVSSFLAPARITGGASFTLAMWVHVAKVGSQDTVVSWASRPNDTAEFSYGKDRDGAFCGWARDTGYTNVPAPGQWHHIAYTYADKDLRIYVDGELDGATSYALTPRPGEPIYLGTAWDRKKGEPAHEYRGALAAVRIWDRTLSHREVRNEGGFYEPFAPQPPDKAEIEDQAVALRWERGDARAGACRVIVGEDRSAVEAGQGQAIYTAPSGSQASMPVQLGGTYHWRVDQLDAEGRVLQKSPVWSFSVSASPATAPTPRDRVAGVSADTVELAWTPGRHVVSQEVCFGTDAAAVALGRGAIVRKLPASSRSVRIPTLPLRPGTTYYWAVRQDNGALPSPKPAVWAFRTADAPVDDEVTFFVVSDTHYGLDPRVETTLIPALVDQMNWLPGQDYPAAVGGGIVRTPRAVVHLGDTTNDGKQVQWDSFVRDFGLQGEARLAYPVYEGFGNHDGGVEGPIRQAMRLRNTQRKGLTALSDNGVHYCWDWAGVHFVHLNISVGSSFRPYDPQYSYEFLADDLQRRVKNGQPVVLMQHFGMMGHSLGWWEEEARERYYNLVKDYNVIAIFHGHNHESNIYQWKGIDILDLPHVDPADAAPDRRMSHGFYVVRITKDELLVVQRNVDGTWGPHLRKSIRR